MNPPMERKDFEKELAKRLSSLLAVELSARYGFLIECKSVNTSQGSFVGEFCISVIGDPKFRRYLINLLVASGIFSNVCGGVSDLTDALVNYNLAKHGLIEFSSDVGNAVKGFVGTFADTYEMPVIELLIEDAQEEKLKDSLTAFISNGSSALCQEVFELISAGG